MVDKQKTPATNKQFCVRRAEVQNSTFEPRLNISNKFGRSASIFRPNAKLSDVIANGNKTDNHKKESYERKKQT